jgi:hypothetical protein
VCIIIDANVSHTVFSDQPSVAGLMVREWIANGSGQLVFGGKNAEELFKTRNAKAWILQAWRGGRAKLIRPERIDAELSAIANLQITSDDAHVLALARASGARSLFSEDNELIRDFKDREIITPRGRVFRRVEHRLTVLGRNSCPCA